MDDDFRMKQGPLVVCGRSVDTGGAVSNDAAGPFPSVARAKTDRGLFADALVGREATC